MGVILTTVVCQAQVVIRNTGYVDYTVGAEDYRRPSNEVSMTVPDTARTPSIITFHKYAPSVLDATEFSVRPTRFRDGGTQGLLELLSDPDHFGDLIDLNVVVPFLETQLYRAGDPIFFTVRDLDQNLLPTVRETVLVTLEVANTGDVEELQLTETGVDTGLFIGYIPSTADITPTFSGVLSVTTESEIVATYTDDVDGTDVSVAAALVDPFGVVFDSSNGDPIDGASVTIVDVSTGQPATVFGDDGVSSYPSTVVTGQTVVDSGDNTYPMPAGSYRFPLLTAGTYRLEITPPSAYTFPSTVSDGALQTLVGAPFELSTASRGADFVLQAGPAVQIDVPLDPGSAAPPGLYLRKEAAEEQVSIGDFLRYDLVLENTSAMPANQIRLVDTLPAGFRYQSGSAYLDQVKIEDPEISANGRTLTFEDLTDLIAGGTAELRYVVEVTSGTKPGVLKNLAQFEDINSVVSNLAEAPVTVDDDLLGENILIGRVMIRPKDRSTWTKHDQTIGLPGLEGARVFLEDGTYVITDKEGRFHFEGVSPGVHVVQLDLVSVPEQYEPVGIENSRFAGRSYSQFVDCQAGIMWRTDFFVTEKPPRVGRVEAQLEIAETEAGLRVAMPLKSEGLPMTRARAMFMLPKGYAVDGTEATLGDRTVPLSVMGTTVTATLGTVTEDLAETLVLNLTAKDDVADAEVKAILFTDVGEQTNLKTELMVATAANPAPAGTIEQTVEWSDVVEDEAVEPVEEVRDALWLSQQDASFEWVEPADNFVPAIPSLKMGIKYPKGSSVKLYNKGQEVSGLYVAESFDATKQHASMTRWRGLNLQLGANPFEAVLFDANGQELQRIERTFHYSGPPVKAEFVPEASILVADGRTQPAIALRLIDSNGQPARPGVIGEYSVDPPYQALMRDERRNRFLEVGEADDPIAYEVGADGIALLKLEPTSQSGEATVRVTLNEREYDFQAWLEPALRDWILVGLASGTAGYESVSENIEDLGVDDLQDGYYDDGRVAFFAKGKVKGKWLLTAAYDNKKDSTVNGQESLHQVIDPDSYYTLYGDETDQGYEAASAKKLYVKLERKTFYAMYGDFDTGLTVAELSNYSRSLTGLKSEYNGRNFTFNGFVSETDQSYAKDEIRGDGTSGLYRLSQRNLIINSDKIRIETRDRFQSQKILNEQRLTRHLDYNINYQDGTIYFKRPVYSKDENLNPIFIVAEYETSGEGEMNYNYGGRASVKTADDRAELGGSYVHEEGTETTGNLYGVDARVQLNEQNELRAEVAHSENDAVSSTANDSSGTAYLVELEHRSTRLEGTAYFREQDDGFGLGQQSISESGTRKMGVDARYRVGEQLDLVADVYHQENTSTGDTRDVVDVGFERRWEQSAMRLGYIWAEDDYVGEGKKRSDQVHFGVSQNLFADKVVFRADHYQSLSDSNDNIDYPTRTILGLDYYINQRVRLFSEYELTQGKDQDTEGARVGMATQPWTGASIETSMQQQIAEDGGRTLANLGLAQSLQLTEHWSIDGGIDGSRTFNESGNGSSFNPNVPNASGARRTSMPSRWARPIAKRPGVGPGGLNSVWQKLRTAAVCSPVSSVRSTRASICHSVPRSSIHRLTVVTILWMPIFATVLRTARWIRSGLF